MTYDSNDASVIRAGARWRKSSYSGYGECVEIAELADAVAVRNSKRPHAGTVVCGTAAMADWIEACKAGQFDDLSF